MDEELISSFVNFNSSFQELFNSRPEQTVEVPKPRKKFDIHDDAAYTPKIEVDDNTTYTPTMFSDQNASWCPDINDTWNNLPDMTIMLLMKEIADQSHISRDARSFELLQAFVVNLGLYFQTSGWKARVLVIYNFIMTSQLIFQKELLLSLVARVVYSNIRNEHLSGKPPPSTGFFPTAGDDSMFDSLPSFLDKVADDVQDGLNSTAWVALNRIFCVTIASSILGSVPETTVKAACDLGVCSNKGIIDAKNMSAVEKSITMMRAVSALMRFMNGSYKDVSRFQCSTDYEWITCAQWLKENEKLRYLAGTPPLEGHVPDQLWRDNLETCVKQYAKVYSKDVALRSIMAQLNREISTLHTKARCADYGTKPLPVNIGLKSPPGLGKSTVIAPALGRAALMGLGVNVQKLPLSDFDRKYATTLNMTDKYLSAYINDKHIIVKIDELGSANPQMDTDNQIMQNITSILGEGLFYINRASVEDKGKDIYKPFVNILMSNNQNYGVGSYITNVDAFVRRIHVNIEVHLREQFKYDDKREGLDASKLDDPVLNPTGDRMAGIYFHVYHGSGTECFSNPVVDSQGNNKQFSFAEVHDYVFDLAKKHNYKSSRLNTTHEWVDSNECEHGYMSKDNCLACNPPRISQAYHPTSEGIEYYSNMTIAAYLFVHFCQLTYILPLIAMVALWSKIFNRGHSWLDELKDRYAMLKRDACMARDLTEHVDLILTRYETHREEILQLRTGAIIGLLGAVIIGVMSYKYFSGSSTPEGPKQADYIPTEVPSALTEEIEGEGYSKRQPANPWDVVDGFISPNRKAQVDLSTAEKWVSSNVLKLTLYRPKLGIKYATHVTGIKQNYAIGVWHFLRWFADPDNYIVVQKFSQSGDKIVMNEVSRMRGHPNLVTRVGEDLGIVKLLSVNSFKDISGLIPKEANYEGSLKRVKGVNFYRQKPSNKFMKAEIDGFDLQIKYDDVNILGEEYNPRVFIGKFKDIHVGHCGTPLLTKIGSTHHLNGIAVATAFDKGAACFHQMSYPKIAEGIALLEAGSAVMTPSSRVDFEDSPQMRGALDSVQDPDSRSQSYWLDPENRGNLEFYGCIPQARYKQQSRVKETRNAAALKASLPDEYKTNLVPPSFGGRIKEDGEWVSPDLNAIHDMRQQVDNIDIDILTLAIDDYVAKLSGIKDFEEDRILSLDACINGTPGTAGKSMPMDTSAGFPDGGKKYDHLELDREENGKKFFKLDAETQKRFDEMLIRATEGEANGIVYKTCLKDEPRDKAKVADRKIRLFTLGPMNFYLLCRKFFGAFMNIYTANFAQTETVGGVNNFSPDWGKIYQILSKHPHAVNGDFSKYDKFMASLMIWAAATVIVRVKKFFLKLKGDDMSPEYENAIRSIISDISNPMLLLSGDLLKVNGSLSSGVLMTFLINDIVNSLYIRMAFFTTYRAKYGWKPEAMREAFRKNVAFMSLGDDNTYTLSTQVRPYFNFETIQAYFKSIGLKYTNADKTDGAYTTVEVDACTIGKRKWVFDEKFQYWMSPIEKPSIMKMLTIGIPSKALTVEEHEKAVLDCATIELALHGEEEYNKIVAILAPLYPHYSFPTRDYMMQKIVSKHPVTPWVPEMETPDFSEYEFTPTMSQESMFSDLYDAEDTVTVFGIFLMIVFYATCGIRAYYSCNPYFGVHFVPTMDTELSPVPDLIEDFELITEEPPLFSTAVFRQQLTEEYQVRIVARRISEEVSLRRRRFCTQLEQFIVWKAHREYLACQNYIHKTLLNAPFTCKGKGLSYSKQYYYMQYGRDQPEYDPAVPEDNDVPNSGLVLVHFNPLYDMLFKFNPAHYNRQDGSWNFQIILIPRTDEDNADLD
jgi:hypothetical protein